MSATAGTVWLKAVMSREGDDVVTRCCVVTDGQFFPIEVRVNVPKLIAQARALGIDKAHGDVVGGFGSWLKKAVKKVTKNKIVSSVAKVVAKTVKSPIFQTAVSIAAPGIGTAAMLGISAATGSGIVKTIGSTVKAVKTIGSAIKSGKPMRALSALPAIGQGALSFVSPEAAAAVGIGLKTIGVAKDAAKIAGTAKLAERTLSLGRTAAAAVANKTVDPKKAQPLIAKAAKLKAELPKIAPALAKKAVESQKVKTQLGAIAAASRKGDPDAKLAARVMAISAKALGAVDTLKSAAPGGIPGFVVTAQGKIVRAPKGRFIEAGQGTDTLYRGPNAPQLRGRFTAVQGGPSWGGSRDPGNDLEGPLYAARHTDGRVLLESWSGVAGLLTP